MLQLPDLKFLHLWFSLLSQLLLLSLSHCQLWNPSLYTSEITMASPLPFLMSLGIWHSWPGPVALLLALVLSFFVCQVNVYFASLVTWHADLSVLPPVQLSSRWPLHCIWSSAFSVIVAPLRYQLFSGNVTTPEIVGQEYGSWSGHQMNQRVCLYRQWEVLVTILANLSR